MPALRLQAALFPYTTLFRSQGRRGDREGGAGLDRVQVVEAQPQPLPGAGDPVHRADLERRALRRQDRKSTRLNSSHANTSYADFCLKKSMQSGVEQGTRAWS